MTKAKPVRITYVAFEHKGEPGVSVSFYHNGDTVYPDTFQCGHIGTIVNLTPDAARKVADRLR